VIAKMTAKRIRNSLNRRKGIAPRRGKPFDKKKITT
jgi:hypothetical protein